WGDSDLWAEYREKIIAHGRATGLCCADESDQLFDRLIRSIPEDIMDYDESYEWCVKEIDALEKSGLAPWSVPLVNSFSLNMLPCDGRMFNVQLKKADESALQEARRILKSYIGHEDLCKILGVKFNRETLTLRSGQGFLVAQYTGPRLPEGTTQLPEGAKITYYIGVVDDISADVPEPEQDHD
ncbi:MAG: hypothetical protein N2558_04655, partial [Patescibacteria group bacterium]|nr:hypothetical protein [Patescibacteria group bacterium]